MNLKKLKLGIAVALGVAASPSFATRYTPCDGCTDVQMEQAALSSGIGVIAIGDVTNRKILTFRVYVDKPSRNIAGQAAVQGAPVLTDVVIATASQDLSAFTKLVSFYHTSPIGYHKRYRLMIVPSESSAPALGEPEELVQVTGPFDQADIVPITSRRRVLGT